MSLKRLDNLLNSGAENPLENLVHRAQVMDGLAAELRRAVPDIDSTAIVAANVRDDGDLVVVCANSSWASLLRYRSERLMDAARRKGNRVERCRVRVIR